MNEVWIIENSFEEDSSMVKVFSSKENALKVYEPKIKALWKRYGKDTNGNSLEECIRYGEYTASIGDFDECGLYMYAVEVDKGI